MFAVDWTESTLSALASIWLNASPAVRAQITAATNRIEKELRDRPLEKGESREGDDRIFVEMPLGVLYRVEEKTNKVVIADIWLIRPRKKP